MQICSLLERWLKLLNVILFVIFLLLRSSNESPSLDELINVFETLAGEEIGILQKADGKESPENMRYMLRGVEKTINWLRALAAAIERGIQE